MKVTPPADSEANLSYPARIMCFTGSLLYFLYGLGKMVLQTFWTWLHLVPLMSFWTAFVIFIDNPTVLIESIQMAAPSELDSVIGSLLAMIMALALPLASIHTIFRVVTPGQIRSKSTVYIRHQKLD